MVSYKTIIQSYLRCSVDRKLVLIRKNLSNKVNIRILSRFSDFSSMLQIACCGDLRKPRTMRRTTDVSSLPRRSEVPATPPRQNARPTFSGRIRKPDLHSSAPLRASESMSKSVRHLRSNYRKAVTFQPLSTGNSAREMYRNPAPKFGCGPRSGPSPATGDRGRRPRPECCTRSGCP